MVLCDSIKNTALTHLPEESFHESIMGWQVPEIPGKGKKLLLTHLFPDPSPTPASIFLCIFLPLPTLQNTVNLKNKRCRLAGISNSVIKDGGNFSLPGLIEQAADEDSFLACCQQLR